jgi:uncharacterized protein
MRISVKVHTKSSQKKVVLLDDVYHVYVNVVPEGGKANAAVVEMLAEYFDVSKSKISISSGFKASLKVFEVDDSTRY